MLAGVPINIKYMVEESIAEPGSEASSHRAPAALQGGSLRQSLASFDYRNKKADSARCIEIDVQQRFDKPRGTHYPD